MSEENWRPIETAPKDGTRILVFNGYFGVYSSQFTVEYDPADDGFPLAERRVMWEGYPLGLTNVGLGRWYCVAKLWQPLPPPPSP
jgi:hypothetical protein